MGDTQFILPVILSGGMGTRLWPLSRQTHPKPFLKIDDQSLIQKTYLRAVSIAGVKEILTITNRDLFFYTKDEYDALAHDKISHSFILEPFGRNSAAAIGLAASYAKQRYGDDCILLILPADHLIEQHAAFLRAIDQAIEMAQQEKLVTFGVTPDTPQTGYGYIEADKHKVKRFVEKPDKKTAQGYIEAGNFYWNTGMFCMRTDIILNEMQTHCPDIINACVNAFENAPPMQGDKGRHYEIAAADFEDVHDISIDYAVFEKADNIAIVACDIGWSDIGSWLEFGGLYKTDADNNHIMGEMLLDDVQDCIIHSQSRIIASLGLRDLIIADTPDALLIADKAQAQNIGKIAAQLKAQNHPAHKTFAKVYRPWGSYTVLQHVNGYKLKRIEVNPRAALSLQSHQHRSEHWVVVSGTARVTNGDETFLLAQNQSTYIPAGNKHRLENPEDELLIMIEVQCGDYLEEDDIIRYDDDYGRLDS